MPLSTPVTRCHLCGAADLEPLLDLGTQALTGHFPKMGAEPIPAGPLALLRCRGECGLVQLSHIYDGDALYGSHYGYRSGLNASMVRHLADRAELLKGLAGLAPGDTVLDIGSNDGTFLSNFPDQDRVGIDPSSEKFSEFYPGGVTRSTDYFSRAAFERLRPGRKAKAVSSIAMFYDLPDPLGFARDVAAVLAPDGVWFIEASYLPRMMENNGYDSVCHEHLEYYALAQLKWIAEKAGLRVVHASFNEVNGGSFGLALTPEASSVKADGTVAAAPWEAEMELLSPAAWARFRTAVEGHRRELKEFLVRCRAEGKRVHGLGASTKGNVILQYCGITRDDLPIIYEVNRAKFGCETPGTKIPIVSEAVIAQSRPDFLLVLPWHFREHMLKTYTPERTHGARLVFPLPTLQVL